MENFQSNSGLPSKSLTMMKKPVSLKSVQKSLTGFSPIELSSSEIVFDGIVTGERYEVILYVTNTSNSSRRIRVFQPRNPRFRCLYSMTGAIAPGLSIPLSIVFETPDIGEFHESIKIVSEEAVSLEVALKAYPKQGYIMFEPCIDLGFTSVNKFNESSMRFRNHGEKQVRIEPRSKVDGLTFEPIAFQLGPSSEQQVKITYFPRQTGFMRTKVEVMCDGGLPYQESFEILSTVVHDELLVVDLDGNQSSKLDFGTLYFGEEKFLPINLLNNTAKAVLFEKNIKTPSEYAKDLLDCVFQNKSNGETIKPYKNFSLNIRAFAKVTEDLHIIAWHYAIAKSETDSKKTIDRPFDYALQIYWRDEITNINLSAKFITPTIEFSSSVLMFGECPVNEFIDLHFVVTNKNVGKSIDFEFNRKSGFKFTPNSGILECNMPQDIRITFSPQSLGIYKSDIILSLLNFQYNFIVNVIASSTSISEKVNNNFSQENLINSDNLILHQSTKGEGIKSSLSKYFSKAETLNSKQNDDTEILSPTLKSELNSDVPPIKIEENARLRSPKLELPKEVNDLWVQRAVGKYEPYNISNIGSIEKKPRNKPWPSEPSSNKEKLQCKKELEPSELERIKAAPNLIELKNVFVKSMSKRMFIIRNSLRNTIKVKLDSEAIELNQTDFIPQFIPSGEAGSFEISFTTEDCGKYNLYVRYIINDIHEFFILIQANVTPVDIKIPKNTVKFNFPDNSLDMQTSEELVIQNNGNSTAKFIWIYEENSVFIPDVIEDEIKEFSEKKVLIHYKPVEGLPLKQDEDVLLIRIYDGEDKSIRCNANLIESRCSVIPEKFSLGTIPVCNIFETSLILKNNLRNFAVFNIVSPLPPGLTLNLMRGRLLPEETKQLKLSFQRNEEVEVNETIRILIRGGKTINIPFNIKTTIPKITIEEEGFDFGMVTVGNESIELPLTIINEGETSAELIIDFSNKDSEHFEEIYENLTIQKLREKGDKEEEIESTFMSIKDDENTADFSEDKLIEEEENDQDTTIKLPQESDDRKFKVIVKPFDKLKFSLKFIPRIAEEFECVLPISLSGFGPMESLERVLHCSGVMPIYQLEPHEITFPKKIISSLEKRKPLQSNVKLINPTDEDITFKFLIGKFSQENPFEFSVTEGIIEPNSEIIVSISFGPMTAGNFNMAIPISINDKVASHLKLKAVSKFPSLAFDRRELILPITPVGIPAKLQFNILNEGYENLAISHSFAKEFGHYDVELNYISGRQIGVTRNKLRTEIVFTASRAISFTTKLNIYDSVGRCYSIVVSGTAENSVFTLYPFIYRVGDFSGFIAGSDRKLQITEENLDEILDFDRQLLNTSVYSGKASMLSSNTTSGMSFLGYSRVSLPLYERCCETVKRWINKFLPNNSITNFPKDVINGECQQLIEIVRVIGGLNFEQNIPKNSKSGKLSLLFAKYEQFIHLLKEYGASLNTIRPEFLFNYQMYTNWVKMRPTEFSPNAKFTANQFAYISIDSWLLLFYQIIKIFHCGKISHSKKLNKSNSNIYASVEMEMLSWLEICFNKSFEKDCGKIISFQKDLKDGILIYGALAAYIPALKNSISNLKIPAMSNEDIQYNLERVFAAFYEYGIPNHLTLSELVYAGPQDIATLISELYQILPLYVSKLPNLVFSCILGEIVSKSIELSNNNDRPLSYWVKYDGSPDFSIEENSITLAPKSIAKFKVIFKSRISTPVSGNVTFVSKSNDIFQATPMSFNLISKISGRVTLETWTVQAKLYQQEEIKITLKNDFMNSKIDVADFNITLDFDTKEDPIIPFVSIKDKIKIKKGESAVISIYFTPSRIFDYECKVIFWDNRVGEVQHEIKANGLPPEICGEYRLNNIFANSFCQFEARIPYKNDNFENGKRLQESKIPVALRTSRGSILKPNETLKSDSKKFIVECTPAVNGLTFSNVLMVHDRSNKLGTIEKIDTNINNQDQSNISNKDGKSFDAKSNNSKLSALKSKTKNPVFQNEEYNPFIIKTVEKDREGSSKGKILLTMNFTQSIREIVLYLTVKEVGGNDFRIYKILFSVMPKIIRGSIEIRIPIKEEGKQDLPFINNTERDWFIKTTINKDISKFGNYFNGPIEITVKKSSTSYYPLTFTPKKMGITESKLSIFNQTTLESYEFDLIGIGEEPLAVDHLVLHGKAREKLKKDILIKNKSKDSEMHLKIETDLPYALGEPEIKIKPNSEQYYTIVVSPLMGGLFTGSITFKDDESEHYFWYTISVDAQRPKAEQVLNLSTLVRKAVSVEISLTNPLDTHQVFDVLIEGEGLYGSTMFTIEAKTSMSYELIFIPLRIMKEKGVVSFLNEKLGEICYEFNLVSEDNPPTKIPIISCEVGKSVKYEVEIENPSSQEVIAYPKQSNPLNFYWEKSEIKLIPYSINIATFVYTPSSLEKVETGELSLESKEIGLWKFNVTGRGISPKDFPETFFEAELGNEVTQNLEFKNPFMDSIFISVNFKKNEPNYKNKRRISIQKGLELDGFHILLKVNNNYMPAQSKIIIPILFSPKKVSAYTAFIIIESNNYMKWVFPLKGIVNVEVPRRPIYLECQARNSHYEEVRLKLPGIIPSFGQNKKIKVFLRNVEDSVARALNIKVIKDEIIDENDEVEIGLNFFPLRPLEGIPELVLEEINGGRWIYKIRVVAHLPEVDDEIIITSTLMKSASVTFKLTNKFKSYSKFKAYFTAESDPEFNIIPRSGDLEPLGREGTTFLITFTPVEYGKLMEGLLIIETNDLYWSYVVKGCFPRYKVPPSLKHAVDDHLDQSLEAQLSKSRFEEKNYIVQNMSFSPSKKSIKNH